MKEFTFLFLLMPYTFASKRGQEANYTDTNMYGDFPRCGDKPMFYPYTCYCGNITLSGSDLAVRNHYCCVDNATDECEYTGKIKHSDVICKNGLVKLQTEPCNNQCYNPYRYSKYLSKAAHLFCHEEHFCLPLFDMCTGVCKGSFQKVSAKKHSKFSICKGGSGWVIFYMFLQLTKMLLKPF